jgi:hypothetical protein
MKNKLLLLAMSIMLSAQTLMAQVPSYVPTNGLVGYWPFNGNANDVSGNANNGTVNGNVILTNDRNNIANSAFEWPNTNSGFGSSSYISLPNLTSQFPDGEFSISLWVKKYPNPINIDPRILGIGEAGLIFDQNSSSIKVYLGLGLETFTNPIGDNQWAHIVYVNDGGSGQSFFYLNGNLIHQIITNPNQDIVPNTPATWELGRKSIPAFNGFGGKIDDVGTWNRALTQQEITTMYNGVEVPTYSDTCNNVSGSLTQGLVGYWPFCGNANDDSGNGNNGTVNGATLTSDRFGNANSAYHFNGNQENIKIQNSILPDTPTSFSISMWIKYDGGTSSPRDVICDRSTLDYSYKYRLIEGQVDNDKIYGWYSCSTTTCSTVNTNNLSSNWENIIGVVDIASNQMRLYKNGILIGTSTNGYQYPTQSNSTYIGANVGPFGALDASFLGEIDDIAIWNRALTQQEITNLYNANQCFNLITVTDTLVINVGLLSFNEPVTWANNITIAPNPASSEININFNNITDLNGGTLKIINSLGQEVATTPITTSGTQSIMQLATWGGSGMYYVQIINPQGIVVDVKKIILQ